MNGKQIIYQVLPRLWGRGKFSDWNDASLGYLRSLGVDYVWFTGVPRHATGKDFVKGNPGSPYAIADWFDVNPYLADNPESRMDEFKALVARVHDNGLKCLVDFIPNHVAADYDGPVPVFAWHDGDWTDTRKVNWSDPRTPGAMADVLAFWAACGVDGFRCDMVELVPSDALGALIKNLKIQYPGLLFVAEVYGRENYGRFLDAGFDLLYDKSGVYDILRGIIQHGASARALTGNWQFLGSMQPRMLNFLENHDEQRLASKEFAGSVDRTWAALAFALFFNTASFMLYAGQEAGEDASESSDGRTSIFNWVHPESLSALTAMINDGKALPPARLDTLSSYREILTIARKPVFRSGGTWDLCYCNTASEGFAPDRFFAFARYDDEEAWLVLCNFGDTRTGVSVRFPEELRSVAGIKSQEAFIEAPAHGYALYRINKTNR